MSTISSITVPSHDSSIHSLGLGTWKSQPGQVKNAVKVAIQNGYRHIDCAHVYGNEVEVGEALKEVIEEGVVQRSDLWITSKLWCTDHHPNDVRPAIEVTLKNLGLEYLDLYLIHWPITFAKLGDQLFPTDDSGNAMLTYQPNTETWGAMEQLVDAGLTKFIGLSNFNQNQIQEILDIAKIRPSFLQCESHPYLPQNDLIQFCKDNGIIFEAYSPLGSPDRPWGVKDTDPVALLENEVITGIAGKHGKNAGQVLIKYQIQRGIVVLAKSVTDSRIIGNADVFDFELDEEDMTKIASLENGWRACPMSSNALHPFYPF
eukprot:TRINITY_DN11594_c0_g1_i1.p1 TRINITY_DN11594_c0_g1~~TRINITY_DN11594_c0_g1_i1.p1  ORF type:complete len:317 (-),score=74.69 TRINITY_DN11594_c0_g1_i1:36-986(-)